MKIHSLAPAPGATKDKKRKGRGIASGLGKTSGRGHKGQNARSGGGVRPGFEGGQMPLVRRIPKRGFTNRFRVEYSICNVAELEKFENDTVIDAQMLKDNGVISKIAPGGLKILGNGILTKKLTVKASKFTKSAMDKIQSAGGKAEVV